jgi:hypothetical protein
MPKKSDECISGVKTKSVVSKSGILVREIVIESTPNQPQRTGQDHQCETQK